MNSPDAPLIYFADLKSLFIRLRGSLLRVALLSTLAATPFLFFQEPEFESSGSFRQSARKMGSSEGFKELFKNFNFTNEDNNALSLMYSKRLIRKTAEELGLQAHIQQRSFIGQIFGTMGKNLSAQLRFVPAAEEAFVLKRVQYSGELPLEFFVRFSSKQSFEILDKKKEVIAEGKVRSEVKAGKSRFTIAKVPRSVVFNKSYPLTIEPWQRSVRQLQKKLKIKPDKFDKNLLNLTFSHPSRRLSSAFLNELMQSYRDYLKEENELLSQAELNFLEKRQNELCAKLDKTLEEHVAYLRQNLGSDGFIGLNHEIEMLASPKEEYTSRLFDVDLELRRLEKGRSVHLALKEGKKPSTEVKKEMVSLPLSQKKKKIEFESKSKRSAAPYFTQQKKYNKELHALDFEEKRVSPKHALPSHSLEPNLQWINLETAQSLYLSYNGEIDLIKAKIQKLAHIREEMKKPQFELTSLSSVLEDPASTQVLEKASQLALQLKDTGHSSPREQERIRGVLSVQKKCLADHIEQLIALEKINLGVVEEKFAALQGTSIELIKNEKAFLEDKLGEIKGRMTHFPDKWRLENQLRLKAELSKSMISGMTELVESKNISRHLYQVESKPLDSAIAPLKPKSPGLLTLSLCASLLGTLTFFSFQVARGLPLSAASLKGRHYPVAGGLSPFSHVPFENLSRSDLEIFRKIADLFALSASKCALLVHQKTPHYAFNLAKLLSMRGQKVLLVQCAFDAVVHADEIPGLWHYLTSEVELAPVRSLDSYDFLPMGSVSKNGPEMLAHPRFATFIHEMKQRYDLVLIVSSAAPSSAQSHQLLKFARSVVLTVGDARLEELEAYRTFAEQQGKECLTFLTVEEK